MGICLALGVQVIDDLGSNLEVLVGREVLLLGLGSLAARRGGRRLVGLLLLLGRLLLTLLLALLQLGLGDHLSGHLVEMELGDGISRLVGRGLLVIGHGVGQWKRRFVVRVGLRWLEVRKMHNVRED